MMRRTNCKRSADEIQRKLVRHRRLTAEVLEDRTLLTLGVAWQAVGSLDWSLDGVGSNDTPVGVIEAVVPTGSTVEKAFLYSSLYSFESMPTPTVDFDGTVIAASDWTDLGFTAGFVLKAFRADVTAQVAAKIGGGSAIPFSFAINSEDPNSNVDGEVLAIAFSNPALPIATVAFLDGNSAVAGDSVTFSFGVPIGDPTDPSFNALMSLGIGFGAQPSGQSSLVDVNGTRLTSSAGGQDDGILENGGLITVGGLGDNPANPPDPFAGSNVDPKYDDELYTLDAFLSTGDTSFTVHTQNPSSDDNIFFLGLNVTAEGSVGNDAPTIDSVSISATKCSNTEPGQNVALTVAFSDSDLLDVHTATVDWGDGSDPDGNGSVGETLVLPVGNRSFSANHVYATGGVFDVAITVADDKSGLDDAMTQAWINGIRLDPASGVLQIVGTVNNDTIVVRDGSGLIEVDDDYYPGGNVRTYSPAGIQSIRIWACTGNDRVDLYGLRDFHGSVIVHGGDGNDVINGSAGNDILLGEAGNDVILSGLGDNMIIGGLGADRLYGSDGTDLLVSGRTAYDNNDAALLAIEAEWASGKAYLTHIGNITGENPLADRLNNGFYLTKGTTVFDDADKDVVYGGQGLDWLFFDPLIDQWLLMPGERGN